MNLKDKISKFIIENSNKIKINSKDIKKNDIFIALRGKKYHGNRFINDAFSAGAKYCVTDKKDIPLNTKENLLHVDDIFNFLKNISIKKRLLFSGEVIGITGSAGKTSLKEYLKFFLEKKYKVSASIKSYNNQLGVIISILNININSKYAIFEIGTNNFYEVRDLTNLVKPSQMFITNILSTHLENFKNKKNIAIEKSDIFNKNYNSNAKILYFQMKTNEEKIINNFAIRQKLKRIIKIGRFGQESYVKSIKENSSKNQIDLKILNKNFSFFIKKFEDSHISNLLFVLTFFVINKIDTNIIFKNINKRPLVQGRGSIHKILINGVAIELIDQSYNANPETMIQSIINFSKIKKKGVKKILILGDMNELGLNKVNFHLDVLKETNKHSFDIIILSGDLFKKALKKSPNSKVKYIYRNTSKGIMSYLNNNLHKKAMIMAKCSNLTEVNKFVKLIKKNSKDKIV